jgi:hypothetical protein
LRALKRVVDSESKKSDTETWFLADARCPAGYQFRCPTFCRNPIPALLPVLLGQHRDQKCDICDFWMRDSQTLGMVSERKPIKQKQIAGAFDVAILTLPS